MTHIILLIIFSLLLLPGLAGIFLPLPGLAYMFLMALIFALIERFAHLSGVELAILGGIFVLSIISDNLAGVLGAKYGGANKYSLIAGVLGMVAGSLLLPPFGGIPGIFLGVLLSELVLKTENKKAFRAASASLLGALGGMLVSLILSIIFITLFITFSLK